MPHTAETRQLYLRRSHVCETQSRCPNIAIKPYIYLTPTGTGLGEGGRGVDHRAAGGGGERVDRIYMYTPKFPELEHLQIPKPECPTRTLRKSPNSSPCRSVPAAISGRRRPHTGAEALQQQDLLTDANPIKTACNHASCASTRAFSF